MTRTAVGVPESWRAAAATIAALGLPVIVAGLIWAPARTWPNLLLADVYFLSLALGGAVLMSIHFLSGAAWSVVVRRIAEAMMSSLPFAAALMLTVFFGRRVLYPWAQPATSIDAAMSASKAVYLSAPWVFLRMAIILGLWVWLVRRLRRTSLEQDRSAAPALHQRLIAGSAMFVVVFAITFVFGSIDWIMSLDPRWTSTIFAVYVFAGLLVSALAALTLIAVVLQARGAFGHVIGPAHLHDLGKLLFTFSTLWAYIWLSQYLLIWYGNLPDEVTYYLRRTNGPWMQLFLLNLFMNWVVPFLVLLPRAAKRSPRVLTAVCVCLLIGHWLDLYLLIMPDAWSTPMAGPLEAMIPLAYAALAIILIGRALASAPLVPPNDPYLNESVNHET
ncbi:MAG TPA: hypothetical protein VKB50_04150 [Vicinamibacterales bacterium]|nr:hypothetical protein [Vicinamibacterales bacterium]